MVPCRAVISTTMLVARSALESAAARGCGNRVGLVEAQKLRHLRREAFEALHLVEHGAEVDLEREGLQAGRNSLRVCRVSLL